MKGWKEKMNWLNKYLGRGRARAKMHGGCKEVLNLLHDYLSGELPAAERALLEEHLKDCLPCLEFLEGYKRTVELVRELSCEDMPEELRDRLHRFLSERIRQKS